VESFNYISEEGLSKICAYLSPIEIVKEGWKAKDQKKEIYLPFERGKI